MNWGRIIAVLMVALPLGAAFGEPVSSGDEEAWQVETIERLTSTQLKRLGSWQEAAALGRSRKSQLIALFDPDAAPIPAAPDATVADADLEALVSSWIPGTRGTLETHFKILGVESDGPNRWTTRVRAEWVRRDAGQLQQRIAEWTIGWSLADAGAPPRIRSLAVGATHSVAAPQPLFREATQSALGPLADASRLLYGSESWFGKCDALGELNLMGHNGIAVGDANGDGLEDLYVGLGSGFPNLLLIRQADGSVVDRADASGVAWLDDTKGVLFIDSDGDGDQDLVTAVGPSLVLAKNDGHGKFGPFVQLKAASSAPFYSVTASDYDGDGDLDLYGTRYVEQSYGVSIPIPFHDANNGPSNHLFRNEGNDRFIDATRETGLDRNNRRFSLAAGWEDFDNDGDPDLYVANDFGRNNLYRNDDGTFTDVAAASGVEDQAAGMGLTWADANGDRRFDLHVSNMFSSAGQRVSDSDRFLPRNPDARSGARRLSLGNSLFLAQDSGGFRDVSEEAGIRMGRWSWGALFVDLENDGDPDLIVPNGFLTGPLEDDL